MFASPIMGHLWGVVANAHVGPARVVKVDAPADNLTVVHDAPFELHTGARASVLGRAIALVGHHPERLKLAVDLPEQAVIDA